MTLQTEQHINVNERQLQREPALLLKEDIKLLNVPYLIYVISNDLEFDIMVIAYHVVLDLAY